MVSEPANVPVILFKYYSESENNLVSRIYSRGKNYYILFSSLVCQQIPSREIQTREALYFPS